MNLYERIMNEDFLTQVQMRQKMKQAGAKGRILSVGKSGAKPDIATIASMLAPSPYGDLIGLANDINQMRMDPKKRTWYNTGMALLGVLPFFPAAITKLRLAPALKMKSGDIVPGKFGGMHFQILDDLPKRRLREEDVIDSGFIDESGKYFTRKQAMEMALKEVPEIDALEKGKALYSEDIIKHHGLDAPFFR